MVMVFYDDAARQCEKGYDGHQHARNRRFEGFDFHSDQKTLLPYLTNVPTTSRHEPPAHPTDLACLGGQARRFISMH